MKSLILFTLQVTLLACLLGIAVDVVTANVALEYFTVHHPHVVDSDSPWVMTLVWGVGASWWFGVGAGLLLWWVNLRRAEPLLRGRTLRMVAKALVLIWAIMMSVLVGVYLFAGIIPESQRKPTFEADRRLMAVALAHMGEYLIAGIIVITLMVRISRLRRLGALTPLPPLPKGEGEKS